MMQSVQLSHDEFLMLLGFLRLPMPLAFGSDPLEDYTDETFNAALTSATTSLVARDYILELPTNSTPPKLLPHLEDLVAISAQPELCLMVAARKADQQTTLHYSQRGDKTIVHTSPRERVHRLEYLERPQAIVDQLIRLIEPHEAHERSLMFTIATTDADALGKAVDLAAIGQSEAALNLLQSAGVPVEAITAFRDRMGSEIARYALVAVRNLQRIQPTSESSIVLRGAHETWYAETRPASDDVDTPHVRVTTVGADALRATLNALMTGAAARRPEMATA
jgi:hypothetical protein